MAKDRKKLLHIHSSIPDKQPTASSLEVGEIAVNNAENQEFLSLKNSNDKVVRFSSDEQIVTIMEKKEVMPYDGYVRGETGPSGTKDGYGSYGITENDLLSNTSNIVIKLNQVAAGNTVKHDEVNGAKDRYNKCVNPTSDSGLTDGAGFYIDMSRYAMQGANPTFSGITNTCYTELNGRTEILGGSGTASSCRSLLNIDVLSATTNVSSAWTTGGTADTTISSAKTDIETALTEITSANTTIGTDILHVSGTTTETHDGVVSITNNNNKTETTTGVNEVNNKSNYNVNTSGDTNLTSTGDTNIHSDANICETADANATFYGAVKTNVGLNCNDNASATTTNVYGGTLNTSASTANVNYGTLVSNVTGATVAVSNESLTIGTANTTVTLANTTATTANYSGQTLSIAENTTDITSCGHLYINTNDFKLQQCDGSEGSAEFKFCDGFTVDSDAITLEQCGTNGSITIKEKDTTISGTNLTVNEGDDVIVNVGDDFTVNTTGDTTFTVTGKTVINSTDDVCISSQDDASFYGKNNTKIGVSCDGSVTTNATVQSTGTTNLYAPTVNISGTTENNTFTTINTTGTTINQTGTNYNVTANTETHNTTSFTVNSTDACIVSTNAVGIGGDVVTNVGANCEGTAISNTTNIYGDIINTTAVTENTTATTINNTATTINNNTTNYNITGDTYISGSITIGTQCNQLSSNTVADSFCEIMDRSKVSFVTGTYAATDENLKWYELWQNGKQLKDQNGNTVRIDIPKDHILKDVSIVNGHASGDSFTACTAGDKTCEWYIKLVWNVFDPSSGHANDKTVYLPANNLVQDHEFIDTPAIDFTTEYDGQVVRVSADTTVKIVSPNGDKTFSKNNAVHSLNSYQLTTQSGTFAAQTFDPFKENVTINVPTDASHITRKTLKVTHNGFSDTYDPGADNEDWTMPHSALTATYEATSGKSGSVTFDTSAAKSISIPTCVSHLNRRTLKWTKGAQSNGTYDPGNSACSGEDSISIPGSLSDLTDWSNNCLKVNNNLCVSGTVTATQGMYTSSDERLKDDVNFILGEDIAKVERVYMKSFRYKDDPSMRKVYGVIAQDLEKIGLEELVHYDEKGMRSVDYTGFLLLKLAALEKQVSLLKVELENYKKEK